MQNDARTIAEEVIQGKRDPYEALELMQKILRESNYSSRFIQFLDLDEDINFLKYSSIAIDKSLFPSIDVKKLITIEFKSFIEFEKIVYQENADKLAFCEDCGEVHEPVLKRKFQLKLPIKKYFKVCKNCNSIEVCLLNSLEGQKKILKRVKNDLTRKS